MESVSPIVACPRNIIDEISLVKYLAYLALQQLVGDSFLHINHHCPGLELVDFGSDGQRGVSIHIPEEGAECLVILSGFVIFGVLLQQEFPKLVANLVAALADLDGD